MTLSSFPNHDSSPVSIQPDMPKMQMEICKPVIVEPNKAVPVSPETAIEIPPSLKESFDKVYSGSDFLRREYSLMLEASKQILPTGESMSLDTYRRLYNLRFEKELPPYPEQWIWQNPTAWTKWFKSLCMRKHAGALVGKGVLLFAKWGTIGTTVGSVLWASGNYLRTYPERQHQAHNQAWQVINSANGSDANGGRVDALQVLVKDKVSLAKLIAPKAYLAVSYDKKTDTYQGIKLPGADLWDADLRKAILPNADLKEAILDAAKLNEANLNNAMLDNAKLRNANLKNANLKNANLKNANLTKADLRSTDFRGADLTEVILTDALYDDRTVLSKAAEQIFEAQKALKIAPCADLEKANLRGVDLEDANLSCVNPNKRTNLRGANLMDIDLRKTKLEGADLTDALYNNNTFIPEAAKKAFKKAIQLVPGAKLSGARLENADLRFVDLQKANLTGAYLSGANLMGTNLIGADLTGAQLKDAQYNRQTVFPEGFDPVKAEMQQIEE